MNQDMIAIMATEIEAARFLVYRSALQKDEGMLNNVLETSMAKYYAGEVPGGRRTSPCGFSAPTVIPPNTGGPLLPGRQIHLHRGGTANIQKTIIAMDQLGSGRPIVASPMRPARVMKKRRSKRPRGPDARVGESSRGQPQVLEVRPRRKHS